jgi:hypothetical protein
MTIDCNRGTVFSVVSLPRMCNEGQLGVAWDSDLTKAAVAMPSKN